MQILSPEEIVHLVKKDKQFLIEKEDWISLQILKSVNQIMYDEHNCEDRENVCEFLLTDISSSRCKLFNITLSRNFPMRKCADCSKVSKELYSELYI